MIRALKDAGVAQPDDAVLVMGDFGAVVIVRFELVRLDMSVNERMWVIGVDLVQVLPRHRGGTDEPRHQGESRDGAPGPGRHKSIMDQDASQLVLGLDAPDPTRFGSFGAFLSMPFQQDVQRFLTQKSGSGRTYIDNMPI